MGLNSIEKEWAGFAAMIFKGMTPAPNQVAEMKKAFFGGATAMITAFNEIGGPDVTEAQGVAYIEARVQETQEFYNNLITEYAEKN